MPVFGAISITSAMVMECVVCDGRSGSHGVYVEYSTTVRRNKTHKTYDKRQEKSRVLRIERMHTDAFLLMKTLSATPRPWYHWKAENPCFLHVLLV